MKQQYDVVILGSGIAGSILAAVLGKMGIDTLVVEKDTHPRFAIGESTLPTTTFLLRSLAHRYGIAELAEICSYEGLRKHDCAAWPKQVFWFGVHQAGRPLAAHHECINEALLAPLGPDVHMLRADVDSLLVSLLPKYGVEYVEQARSRRFEAHADHALLDIETAQGVRTVRAKLVVDATGHGSPLCQQLGLRDAEPQLRTNTRSIFGHFRGVPAIDPVLGGPNPAMRFNRAAGTQHHCFDGGWFWVIPFDNEITSVGLELDRNRYPRDPSLSPEAELRQFIERFPSVQAHLGAMSPVRPLIATDRIQFTSSSMLSERFVATPHAAAFVEPLFSTGIMLTLSFIDRFARIAGDAHRRDDWSMPQFSPVEQLFKAEVTQIDLLVDGMFQAFRDYDLFKQYWRAWVIGTYVQYGCCILADGASHDRPMLYGAGIDDYVADLQRMHALVTSRERPAAELAAEIKGLIDPWWEHLIASVVQPIGDFATGSPQALNIMGNPASADAVGTFFKHLINAYGYTDVRQRWSNVMMWMTQEKANADRFTADYLTSQALGSQHHRAIDFVLAQALPGGPHALDYRAQVQLTAEATTH